MTVRLIAISKPVVEDVPDTTGLLAYCARVSSIGNQANHGTGGKLLRSLVNRREWSPFEMVSATFEIETTRDIARQILRHRSFSFQEFSQRYAAVVEPPVLREARLQDTADRQNSIPLDAVRASWVEQTGEMAEVCPEVDELADWWTRAQTEAAERMAMIYQTALDRGIAKEVARAVLPEGMTPSRLYMAGTLRSWLHYLELRCDRKTQKEHRLIASAISDVLKDQLPDLKDLLP